METSFLWIKKEYKPFRVKPTWKFLLVMPLILIQIIIYPLSSSTVAFKLESISQVLLNSRCPGFVTDVLLVEIITHPVQSNVTVSANQWYCRVMVHLTWKKPICFEEIRVNLLKTVAGSYLTLSHTYTAMCYWHPLQCWEHKGHFNIQLGARTTLCEYEFTWEIF